MKDSNLKKLYLGFFVVLSTIILIISLYFIGSRQNLFGKTFTISALFNNIEGLQMGNNVRYSGINVGTVKRITMINDSTICVDMLIEDKIISHMKNNIIASVGSDGLVGSMVINILPNPVAGEPIKPGDTINSFRKITTSAMLETLSTTNENAALLTADLLKITSTINDGKGTLGMLLKDSTMAANLKMTLANLKTASEKTSYTMNELKKIISSIKDGNSMASVILSDSVSGNKMKSILNNLETSSAGIDSVITNLNLTILDIKNGEGPFNYVVKDSVATKEIDATIKNLKEASILLNEDLEALQHNFFFRGYFKKQEKKESKKE